LKLGELFFKSRGYTPIPFLLVALIFANPQKHFIVVGLIMILFGEFMRLWGVSYAGAATRTREAGASELVSNGPFAYVRNPLYVGNILIYVGAVVLSGVWFPYLSILVFLFFYFQYTFIISHEEDKLEELFKESYIEYKKHVPRFIPKFIADKNKSNIVPQIKKAFKSEKSTFIAMGTFLALFILRVCSLN
jgi:protein-S-isoprenylcysteine O-methyltransferase Ste14